MCGRYRLTAKQRYMRDHFGLDEDPPWEPRWNVAPTQQIATIRQHRAEPTRIFGLMRWGLIPYWAKDKQPYNFGLATGSVFAFAGLWDRWRDPKNNIVETCTILTTQPNSLVADVHDRMPAILRVEDYEGWLDPGITDAKAVLDCLKPLDASLMKKYPVSPRVNRPENDDEEYAREVPIESAPMTLF